MPAITQAGRDYDRALQQKQYNEAMKSSLEVEKLQLDLQEKIRETPESKIALAEDMAMRREALKQKQQGIEFGDVAKNAALQEDLSLLEASKKQGAADIENRMLAARGQAMENILMGGKGLVPTATVNMGGVKQQVLPERVGRTTADINEQIFQAQVPQLTKAYIAQGYDQDTAVKMAGSDVTKNLFKAQSSGKVVLTSNDGMSTISYTNEQAQKMWKDPSTPKFIKTQLNNFFGESEQPAAGNWIKTRLGR
jgi:hypothetical protein